MHTVSGGAVRTRALLHEVAVGHDPNRIAIRDHTGTELTYRQLEHHTNQLAHALHTAGIGPGHIIALLLNPGIHLLTARLAVMKAGAAWMPLDPQHPPTRLRFQITDTNTPLLLTHTPLTNLATQTAPHTPTWHLDDPTLTTNLTTQPTTPPNTTTHPNDPAYLIYTSGSTGTPKGVLVSHHSATHYCHTATEQFTLTPHDRIPLTANPAFDVTIFDCFATLLAGATIITAPRDTITNPNTLTHLLHKEHITFAYIPPAILDLLNPHDLTNSNLRGLFCAGETLRRELLNRWSRPGLAIHNSYGPTEATVTCTNYPCPPTPQNGPVPIGAPQPGYRAYVLNKRLKPVPVGITGELYIAGTGVAHGYLNQPGLTAQRFLPDLFADTPGARMYATGDLARWQPNGQLEHLGRTDRQVKLHGQRIELGEIEHALTQHPAIRQCAVTLHNNTHLAAYLVTHPNANPNPTQLREHLTNHLPTYMIPTTFTTIPKLPLTPNGKLDTTQLPNPTPPTHNYIAPHTPTQRWLATIWQELLNIQRISANDNFFDLGGNSLHGTQLVARARDTLHITLDLHDLFTHDTLADLAAKIDSILAGTVDDGDVDDVIPLTPDGRQAPLFLVHPAGGSVAHYVRLAALLGDDQPCYAIEDPALHGASSATDLAARADRYVELIRQVRPSGPYRLGGWSTGGVVALELARRLVDAGERVEIVVALDSRFNSSQWVRDDLDALRGFIRDVAAIAGVPAPDVDADTAKLRDLDRDALEDWALAVLGQAGLVPPGSREQMMTRMRVFVANSKAHAAHRPQRYDGRVVLLSATDNDGSDLAIWQSVAPAFKRRRVPGTHYSMLQPRHLPALAAVLRDCLDDVPEVR